MCGFLFLASTGQRTRLPHDAGELVRLRDVLVHRGPDAGESWLSPDGAAALLHRRLKVIDLEASRQPMVSADGKYHLVYNGEIYNFRELRRELEAWGHPFRTRGDTEVLLAAWLRWGPACVEHLNGIFSFVLWDAQEHRVFLARDPLGVKPLYYGLWGDTLYAASEAKAIVADPRVPRRIDAEALDLYLHHGYVPAPWSIWRGMHKLPAAHRLAVPLGAGWRGLPSPERYWQVPLGRERPVEPASEAALLDELDDTLGRAVRRQTVSDVPLGAFLSGGVDSSLVVAYLAEAGVSPVCTFTVGYEEARYDERAHAREVARRFGTEHREIVLRPDSLDLLATLAYDYDEPFADPAALPTAVVSRLAREHVTVVLSGDGGDETHAGYPRYVDAQRLRWLDRIPSVAREALLGPLARVAPSWKRRGLFEQGQRDALDRYDAMTTEVPYDHRRDAYSAAMLERLREADRENTGPGMPRWRRELGPPSDPGLSELDRFQGLDLASALPEQLMVKMDRASMRVSLEARVPLLDLEAVGFAARIPAAWRVRDGRPKYLLRRLLARRMGGAFVSRRKQGFRLPELTWFRAMPRAKLDALLAVEGVEEWLDPGRMRRLLFDAPRGLELLWPFLCLAAWQRRFGGTA